MTKWVVDASVAMKWCLSSQEEQLVPQAAELLHSYDRGQSKFLVPDLFWPELANALWKAVWKEKIDVPWARKAYAKVAGLNIPTTPSTPLVPEALQLAVTFNRTVYDSLYVALALHSQAELITADERLANSMAARFPIRWLGAY